MFLNRVGIIASATCLLVVGLPSLATAAPGAVDQSFGIDGSATVNFSPTFNSYATAIARQSDGKLLVAGWTRDFPTQFAVARLTSNGQTDTSFSQDGKIKLRYKSQNITATSITTDPKNRILVGGYTNGSNSRFLIVRLKPNGTLDSKFGQGGWRAVAFKSGASKLRSLAILKNGHLVAAGNSGRNIALTRLNSQGNLVKSFGKGGKVIQQLGNSTSVISNIARKGNRIVAVGTTTGKRSQILVSRYLLNGFPDPRFGTSGRTTIAQGRLTYSGVDLALTPQGHVIVGGNHDAYGPTNAGITIAKLATNGARVKRFGKSGIVRLSTGTNGAGLSSVNYLRSRNSIILTGRLHPAPNEPETRSILVSRLNSNGTLSTNFGNAGWSIHRVRNSASSSFAGLLQGNRVISAGYVDGSGDEFAITRFFTN